MLVIMVVVPVAVANEFGISVTPMIYVYSNASSGGGGARLNLVAACPIYLCQEGGGKA